ncbi:MAG: DUF4954 family protein [Tidjanibacter sp.]|nr:DUF4954 family protein [Tidjanibacter sp.]
MQQKQTIEYRALTNDEIATLRNGGCDADDWSRVMVASEGFTPESICRCRFKGDVRIGARVNIKDITSFIANYTIGNDVRIINVGLLETKGNSTFGNGTEVAAINENGGRSIRIYDQLTAQAAYVGTLYRHRTKTIEQLDAMALRYTESVRSTMGHIADGAKVCDCKIIRNVNIGECADVRGASLLQNGTIISTAESTTKVGVDVKMYDFIACDGSVVDNGSLLRRCFVGQSVLLENLTATDSLLFAGSHLENCEACSIFAGPFTVSHHASSLLIAGYFSFFNAGSGTNQSNHLFRTGAVHQGIHLRGVKFGSNAYTMLPCRNGAFTVVVGKHRNHGDTDNFPYSYLVEKDGASHLLPAKNLMSYGTVRDLSKWPQRDKRGRVKRDNINFEECTPYVAERFLRAIETLKSLLGTEGSSAPDILNWGRMKITRKSAQQGKKIYRDALYKYLAEMLTSGGPREDISGRGHWIDCSGQYMPMGEMNAILDRVDSGEITTAAELKSAFDRIMDNYHDYAYDWAVEAVESLLGRAVTEEDLAKVIRRGHESALKLKELTEEDRDKDFDVAAQVGYGIDSLNEEERLADFRAVRGK